MRKRLGALEETTIYRVILEALTNTAKYADVSEADVFIHDKDYFVEVRIEDRGKGFNRNNASKGVGLFSMEERAKSIGGQIDIRSELGKGTAVTLIVRKK